MRIKPESKAVAVAVNGSFEPARAIPEMLADDGVLNRREAQHAVVHQSSRGLTWFTVGNVCVEVLPGHISIGSSGPPYGPVWSLMRQLIGGFADVRVGCFHFHRTVYFPVRHPHWLRMAAALVREHHWFRLGEGTIGLMQVKPPTPVGSSIMIATSQSRPLAEAGRAGIRIDVRSNYYGGNLEDFTERLIGTPVAEFRRAIATADSTIDGLMSRCVATRRGSDAI